MKRHVVLMLSLTATVALAHAGHDHGDHLMGTVKSADEKSVTLETKDKKEVTVTFDATTKFERDGKPATAKDVAPGDRVVIMASKKDGGSDLFATTIKSAAGATKGSQ
jgi:hypothetical protein